MSEVSGIELEKDAAGNNSYVRIDLKKYGDMINPILKQLGVIGQTQVDKDWERALDPETFRKEAKIRLRELFNQKHSHEVNQ